MSPAATPATADARDGSAVTARGTAGPEPSRPRCPRPDNGLPDPDVPARRRAALRPPVPRAGSGSPAAWPPGSDGAAVRRAGADGLTAGPACLGGPEVGTPDTDGRAASGSGAGNGSLSGPRGLDLAIASGVAPGQPYPGLVGLVQRRLSASGRLAIDHDWLRAAVATVLHEEGLAPSLPSFAATVEAIVDELTGLGPLAPLLADPAVIGNDGYQNMRNSSGRISDCTCSSERSSCTWTSD